MEQGTFLFGIPAKSEIHYTLRICVQLPWMKGYFEMEHAPRLSTMSQAATCFMREKEDAFFRFATVPIFVICLSLWYFIQPYTWQRLLWIKGVFRTDYALLEKPKIKACLEREGKDTGYRLLLRPGLLK